MKPGARVGVGGWGGPTGSDRTVYGWLSFAEFQEAFPERVEKLLDLDRQARAGHANPLMGMSDGYFVVPPAFIARTRGLERVDLVELLRQEDDMQVAEADMVREAQEGTLRP